MKNYLVLADDFTGANDTGVKLTKHGYKVSVGLEGIVIDFENEGSFVIDTETRNLTAKQAEDVIFKLTSQIDFSKFDFIYKKIDSTLRGNIQSELKALTKSYNPELVVFAPALPSMDRIIKDGFLYVREVRANKTDLTKDPLKPLRDDNVFNIVKKVFPGKECKHYNLNTIRSNKFEITGSERYLTFDTENSTDLSLIVKKVKKKYKKVLWVGSAGLMKELLDVNEKPIPAVGIIGSVSDTTRRQIEYINNQNICLVNVPIYEVYRNDSYNKYVKQADKELKRGKDVVIMSSASQDRNELEKTVRELSEYGLTKNEVSKLTQTVLAGIVRSLILKNKICGVFATGGDTAWSLLELTKAKAVDVIDELDTGIPILEVREGELDQYKLITKAGAFGNDDFILKAFTKLRNAYKRS